MRVTTKARTHHGRVHQVCGTTLKFSGSSTCVHCHRKWRFNRMNVTAKELDAMDAALLANMTVMQIKISEKLIVEIPRPPVCFVNVNWWMMASKA